jgi:carbonic anhydrase
MCVGAAHVGIETIASSILGGDICTVIGSEPTEKFHFRQIQIHVPSEHTMNGEYSDAEMHFMFTNAAGTKQLVVAMFLLVDLTQSSPFLDTLFYNFVDGEGEYDQMLR